MNGRANKAHQVEEDKTTSAGAQKKGQRMKVTLHKTNIPTNLVRNTHTYIGKMQQWQRQTGNEEETEREREQDWTNSRAPG